MPPDTGLGDTTSESTTPSASSVHLLTPAAPVDVPLHDVAMSPTDSVSLHHSRFEGVTDHGV
jgi:hypothetical protein